MRYPIIALLVIVLLSSAMFRFDQPRNAGASTAPLVVTVDDIGPAAPVPPPPPAQPQEPQEAYVPIEYRLELLEKRDAVHDRAFQQVASIIDGLRQTVERLSKSHAREPATKSEEPRPAAPAAMLHRSILMETAPKRIGCLPCIGWVTNEKPVCEADGPDKWQVDVQESSNGPWPRFTVRIGDLQVRENGYLTQKRLKEIERAILDELARRK